MKGPGGLFERQVLASVPKGAYGRKVPDPPTRPPKCRCGGWFTTLCPRCLISAAVKAWSPTPGGFQAAMHRVIESSRQDHPARFTRGNPWDIEVRWLEHAELNVACRPLVRRRFELLIECKSTADQRLAFAAVDEWKAKELAKAAAAGCFAGVLWECRASSSVHYVPIEIWLELEQTIGRKSLPLAVAAAHGIRVKEDPGRGRVHTYYRLDVLMAELAGEPVGSVESENAVPSERQETLF